MDPNIWGPKFWFSLHSLSFTYPFYPDENDKKRVKTFFEMLEYCLPCVVCRVNYKKNIDSFPIDPHLENRKSLVYYVIDLHNIVNIEKGKPALSHDEAISIYEKQFGKKINLDDPEPHITNGKKLSDDDWQKRQEMKTAYGRIILKTQKYWAIIIILLLTILLAFAIFMYYNKK